MKSHNSRHTYKTLITIVVMVLFSGCKEHKNNLPVKEEVEVAVKVDSIIKPIKKDLNNCDVNTELEKFIFTTEKKVDLSQSPHLDEYSNYIYDNAITFKDEILELMTCDNLSEDQKRLLLRLMNGLTYDEYISFIESSYKLYKDKKITKFNLVNSVLFNFTAHRHYPLKYYKLKKTKQVLALIKADSILMSDEVLKMRIEKTLTGEYWSEMLEFYNSPAMAYPKEDLKKMLETW